MTPKAILMFRVLIPKTLSLLVLVSGLLNDQKMRTFTQFLSNADVQNFNEFLNKRERERERKRERERMNKSNRDFFAEQNEK